MSITRKFLYPMKIMMIHSLNRYQACSSITAIYSLPRLMKVSLMSTASSNPNSLNSKQTNLPKKPNLRRAAVNNKSRNVLVAACILVAVYMYPMIFKPMFGIGLSVDGNARDLEDIKNEIDKHRPSFMPKWSSPFGPKSQDE